MSSQKKSDAFKYVFIPAVESEPISQLEGSKAGGLSDDFLAKSAKEYFFEKNGGAARAAALDNASPEERSILAKQIREQYASSGSSGAASQMAKLDDDALINIVRSSQASATCEITALTVPTPVNHYQAVSMYGDDNARTRNLPFNARATALMKATGHGLPPPGDNQDGKPSGIYGDVFVGRCHDDEARDIWERVDFLVEEAQGNLDGVEWCRNARKKGGGGGHGGSAASLTGMMSNALGGGGQLINESSVGGGGGGGGEASENGYKWSQTDEEVEIRFAVAPGTKAKYVKVKFGKQMLKVTVAGQTLCDGETWGDIAVDECTYTIQDDTDSSSGGRELCITLGKKDSSQWNYAVMGK